MANPLLNLQLPWSSSIEDDQRFTKILVVSFVVLLVLSILVTLSKVPEITRAEKEKLPPQLARVVLEKKELPPPKPIEPPKVEEKKPEPKVEEKKPEPVVKPPEPVKKPVAPPKAALEKAREQAANTGVMQFKDDLAEMREMMQTSAVETAATTVTNSTGEAAQLDRAMITSGAKTASGGINTAALSRDTGGTALSGRETTKVKSGLVEAGKKSTQATAGNSNGAGGAARSEEEIRKIMEQHKGAIYSIYNRALRQNAALEGKMVVKIVIDPSGKIVEATLVSSELGDSDLEGKILQRIRLISFPASNVARTTINQTFDFLPQ
ncbi:AgmX/PglI C-terminal domain-containing protein [Cellvibrio sp. QJXJ]|uniref:AgmX/PglI C-terminal domain-containing protein n=1 Tax=Cellvibrio sp. QJXJ TaxID=2964606 RepID=UPI0021C2C094|nr:AgmX/PglI C-terminal domain-containing protein [Cellvibrio sp. QJXJ]UUA71289.1 AgmX/PglI C-terminal domain-containing protein [Cellvibrio sp. QJXJ]